MVVCTHIPTVHNIHTNTPLLKHQDPIVFPEYMNMLGAALYLWSAALYPTERGPTDAATLRVHRIETAAAGIEWLACVGWFITWHLTYLRVPGRGYTLVRVVVVWSCVRWLVAAMPD